MNRNVWRKVVDALAVTLLVGSVLLDSSSARAEDDILEQRRARVESMSAAEKETLRRHQQRFAQLDEPQRQELRELHANISAGPESERLLSVLRLYHRWMQSLTSGERLQLLALPPDQRVRAIKKLVARQEREGFQELVQRSLSVEDREAIFDWIAELALRRMPLGEQQRLRAIEQPLRRRMEIMSAFRRRTSGINDARFLERLNPSVADRKALVARLSPSAQETITATADDPEKRRLIQSWVTAAIFSRRDNRPSVAQTTLDAFFANLDAAEKDYLNNLPPDRKREELVRLYMRNRVRRQGDFRSGDPRSTFGPAGRRRGGPD